MTLKTKKIDNFTINFKANLFLKLKKLHWWVVLCCGAKSSHYYTHRVLASSSRLLPDCDRHLWTALGTNCYPLHPQSAQLQHANVRCSHTLARRLVHPETLALHAARGQAPGTVRINGQIRRRSLGGRSIEKRIEVRVEWFFLKLARGSSPLFTSHSSREVLNRHESLWRAQRRQSLMPSRC